MGLFLNNRDLRLYRNINRQLINKIIGTSINYFKMNILQSKQNIYGQSLQKIYFQNIKIMGLVQFQDYRAQNGQMGYNVFNNLKLRLDRQYMIQIDLYPQVGDVIQWNNQYYDISTVVQNQFIGGQTNQQNKWSIICQCSLTNKSRTNLQQIKSYVKNFNSNQEKIIGKFDE